MCVAGAAIAVGSLSAAQARRPDVPMVRTAQTTGQQSVANEQDATVYLLTGTGLLAIGGVVLVGGVAGLGGLDIPGGITMTVGRSRLWVRSLRVQGRHRRLTGG
ncbi:hypothetical protein GCM10010532_089140 [Dactylosporangium siamense]|uniref:Uncharacterized protein n=1 Tax=Dactylosporangium siamense TaxID=685454 RepID=A0A919PRP0_9ACTN|nr:hypothetical protein Dsi01nite_076760 [Dactylosporangium siamense]